MTYHGFVTRVVRRVQLVERELLNPTEHMRSRLVLLPDLDFAV